MADAKPEMDPEAKEKAKAEAEARRKRIMEKSKARMDKVNGLQEEADAEDEATKTSSAARMQAMRRRRFKKGGKPKEESKDEAEGKTEAAPTAEANTAEEPKKDEPAAAAPAAETKVEEAPKVEAVAAPTPSSEPAEETPGNEKKYKGVAKTRRAKAMQKKKEEAAKAAEEEAKNPASANPAVQARHQKRKLKQPMLPILMYLLTTFLLFLAGLDVGLQHADESIFVNRDFAPSSFSIDKINPWAGSSSNAPIKDLGSDTDAYARGLSEESDEFGTPEESADDYVPNIDPLFQVDLDEATKGPGVVNQLARGAIKIHRFFLYLFIEVPVQIFRLPAQLFSYPPMMCLVALTIRQIFAKLILGAKLPVSIEEDVRNNKEITDVLTMAKNFVKNAIVGYFPLAVSFYEAFQCLKTDMYVILFGVFVGLLCSTWSLSVDGGLQEGLLQDEVMPEPDGISDEL